ncbi:MAG: RNA polymerase sigma factor [Phycisphaeraceae bacterium]
MSRDDGQNQPGRGRDAGAGSPDDFAALYQKAYRVLWVVAAGIASPGVATDLVHQAAVQALAKFDQFTPGTNFTAWMAQIVRYVALNHVRAQQHRHAASLDEQANAPQAPEPRPSIELTRDGQLHEDQVHFDDELMQALASLPATARACLLLRTVHDMSYAEISETLGIPPGTAMSHVHRSRHHLRARLQQRSAAPEDDRTNTTYP